VYKTIEFVLIHFFDLCKEPSWPFSKTVKVALVDQATGETHRRHHVSKDGIYRGRQLFAKASAE
jgi:nitrous oxide reductase